MMKDILKRFRRRKLPTPPIPLAQFCADQKAVDHMRELTTDPVFQQAVACLKAAQTPLPTAVRATAEYNNNAYIFFAGYCAAFEDLTGRATRLYQPQPQDTNQTDEWKHIQLTQP